MQESHTLLVLGIVMILAGPIIMFFGDRRMPVRQGAVFKVFDRRRRAEPGSLRGSARRVLYGAGVLFTGVIVLMKALNAI